MAKAKENPGGKQDFCCSGGFYVRNNCIQIIFNVCKNLSLLTMFREEYFVKGCCRSLYKIRYFLHVFYSVTKLLLQKTGSTIFIRIKQNGQKSSRCSQHTFSANVWLGILCDRLISPTILPNRLTGKVYFDFLRITFPILLEDVPTSPGYVTYMVHALWRLHIFLIMNLMADG